MALTSVRKLDSVRGLGTRVLDTRSCRSGRRGGSGQGAQDVDARQGGRAVGAPARGRFGR
ncbi:hypothetical protein [Streptomyces wuyuanensis]|uniref:hypothetical protein n=1 Tax=Streptomyces wuyuanensis TaxID=1196353 RepID=UPI003D705801